MKKNELTTREKVYLRCLIDCDIDNLKKLLILNEDNKIEEYKNLIIKKIDEAKTLMEKI